MAKFCVKRITAVGKIELKIDQRPTKRLEILITQVTTFNLHLRRGELFSVLMFESLLRVQVSLWKNDVQTQRHHAEAFDDQRNDLVRKGKDSYGRIS